MFKQPNDASTGSSNQSASTSFAAPMSSPQTASSHQPSELSYSSSIIGTSPAFSSDIPPSQPPSAWFRAAGSGNIAELKQLLVNVNFDINDKGNKYPALHLSALNSHVEAVRFMLEHGFNVHLQNTEGDTPLHSAAKSRNIDTINLLLEWGSIEDINIKNKKGQTPLLMLASNYCYPAGPFREIACATVLLAHGANIKITDDLGQTAATIAHKYHSFYFVEFLKDITKGRKRMPTMADLILTQPPMEWFDAVSQDDKECLKQLLATGGFDINSQLATNWGLGTCIGNALHIATRKNHIDLMHLLLEQGADVHVKCYRDGMTPLHYAAARGSVTGITLLLKYRAVADINKKSRFGDTPLSLFVRACCETAREPNNDIHGVNLLLAYGAYINAVDGKNQTPEIQARQNKQYALADHLRNFATNRKPIPPLAISSPLQTTTTSHLESVYALTNNDAIATSSSSLSVDSALSVPSSSCSNSPGDANEIVRIRQCLPKPISLAPAASLFGGSASPQPLKIIASAPPIPASSTLSLVYPAVNPAHFCCSIAADGELMEDPVVNSLGHSYDRKNIEAWYTKSNRDPNTNVEVKDKTLNPNIALKQAIEAHRNTHPAASSSSAFRKI